MWRKERTGVGRWGFLRKMAPGDGLKGAQRRSQRAKKGRDWGRGTWRKSTDMQMCKEGISTSVGVLSKREA